MRRWLAALAFASLPAQANEFCDVQGSVEAYWRGVSAATRALREKRFDAAETFFGGAIKAFEAGALSDAHVGRAFNAFGARDAAMETALREWARRYPESAAAHLALAHFYVNSGYTARGTASANETTESQFEAMAESFEKARPEILAAEQRLKKASPAAALAIVLGRAVGGHARTQQVYREALRKWPDTLQVRIQYIHSALPQWGGSLEELQGIVAESRTLPQADQRYIRYLVLEAQGDYAQVIAKEADRSKAYYVQAVPLCPGVDGALRKLIELRSRTRDMAGVVESSTEFVARHPHDGYGFAMRAYGNEQLHRDALALPDYQRSAELGYWKAYYNLGFFYEFGRVVPKDPRKAIDLYLVADQHQVEGARTRAERLSKASGIPLR